MSMADINENIETLSKQLIQDFGYCVLYEDQARHFSSEETISILYIENSDGHYVSGIDSNAKPDQGCLGMILEHKIYPELNRPDASICTIGFSKDEQKWYGWSHRAMYGFGIGHVVEEGDVACSNYISGHNYDVSERPFCVPPGFIVKTLDDAKKVAIAFSDSIN